MDLKDFFSKLTWVDYAAFIALLRGCYVGYKSGLFPELLRVAAYLITAVVTFRFYGTAAQYLTLKTFLNDATASAAAFCGVLILAFCAAKLVSLLLLKLLKASDGGLLNRLAGAAVGSARWILLLSLLFMAVDYSPLGPLKADIHGRSLTGPPISRIAPAVFDFLAKLSPQLAAPAKESLT